jgi:hybrid cluster-associated redox disulfide protein
MGGAAGGGGATRPVGDIRESSPIADRAIADLVEENEEGVSKVLQKHGLHCVGCEASVGENVIEGCLIHGLSTREIRDVVDELEAVV